MGRTLEDALMTRMEGFERWVLTTSAWRMLSRHVIVRWGLNQEGGTYTVGELRDCLSEAGFRHRRFRQCPGFVYRAIAKRSS
jgi:hypothetical protein